MQRRTLLQSLPATGAPFLAAGLGWTPPSHAADDAPAPGPAWTRESPLTAADLRSDLALLDRLYRELHPGLLRYQTAGQWQHAVQALDAHWARRAEHRLDTAYLDCSRLLARVRCGHTYANFYNQKPAVAQALFAGRNKLPFTFVWLQQQLVATGGALPAGTRVLTVDGVPAAQVLARLLPLVRADGHNDDKRRALLSVDAREGYETFDIFHALSTPAGPEVALTVQRPGDGPRRVTLPTLDLTERRAMSPRPRTPPSDATPPWSLRFDEAGNALLDMPGWALYNSDWNWAAWLDRQLDAVVQARAPRLIVDLRRNEGGLDCGDAILARCTDRPLPVRADERLVRYRRVPAELNAVMDTWDDSFRDWGDRAEPWPERPGFYRLRPADGASPGSGETGGQTIEPRGPRFTGALQVLTSSTNSSATFRFASLVREHRLGTLIGGSTGGNQRGVNGGAFFFVRLPRTGLEVDLPLIGYFPSGPLRPDAGLTPDVPVPLTVADLTAGRDRALDAARRR